MCVVGGEGEKGAKLEGLRGAQRERVCRRWWLEVWLDGKDGQEGM